MSMILDAREFSAGLDTAATAIDREAVVPVLETVRLRRDGDRLAMVATDIDHEVETSIVPTVNGWAPDFCIDRPRSLAKAMRGSGGGSVKLSPLDSSQHCGIICGRLDIEAQTIPGEEFPAFARYDDSPVWSADLGDGVLTALRRLQTYISTESTRYYLNGVYLEQGEEGAYRLVATTGHVMGLADVDLPGSAGEMPTASGNTSGVILPHVALGTVLQIARRRRGAPVRLAIHMTPPKYGSESEIVAEGTPVAVWTIGDVTVRTKCIDGTFPNYRKVIPDNREMATFDRGRLRQAIDLLRTASNTQHHWTHSVTITFEGDTALLRAKRQDGGEVSTVLDCRPDTNLLEGENRCIGVNPTLMSRILDSLHGVKRVNLAFNAGVIGTGSFQVLPVDPIGFQAVMMPMRVRDGGR